MLSDKEYIRYSLETNLFFLRIAKEHAIFAAASLPPRDRIVLNKLLAVKNNYEELLAYAIGLADRLISYEALASDELVTEFTLAAEIKTQFLTGIPINTDLTRKELEIRAEKKNRNDNELQAEIGVLNKKAMELTKATITFLSSLLKKVLECKAFTYTYPTMLEHVTEESRYYVMMLEKLENRDAIDSIKEIIEQEINWNHIMGEHSKFIRGYLDPEEVKLFDSANGFAKEFDRLLERTEQASDHPELLPEVTRESLQDVIGLRDFKEQSVKGLLKCQIKALIPPLLADHVTREANHYLRLLKAFEKKV